MLRPGPRRFAQACLFWLLGGLALTTRADQKVDFDHYSVYYNAVPSAFLTPTIAQRYQIERSKAIGVVTIAVTPLDQSASAEPVEASVEGQFNNDIQQFTTLNFRAIREGKAVYYIAPFQFTQGEMLTFHVKATPMGTGKPLAIRFAQTLFND